MADTRTVLVLGVGLAALWWLSRSARAEAAEPGLFPGGSRDFDEGAGGAILRGDEERMALDDLYQRYAAREGLDWRLLKAIAQVESGENPLAVNPGDPSYGLFQLLYRLDANGQPNRLNVLGWPPDSKTQLFDPEYNASVAAQIIRWNVETYGFKRGIAVYNRWASRLDPPDGPFGNQEYVDRVLARYRALGGTEA